MDFRTEDLRGGKIVKLKDFSFTKEENEIWAAFGNLLFNKLVKIEYRDGNLNEALQNIADDFELAEDHFKLDN